MIQPQFKDQLIACEARCKSVMDEAKKIYTPVVQDLILNGTELEIAEMADFLRDLNISFMDARFLYEELARRRDYE